MLEQVENGDRKIMVGRQQSLRAGHDPMTIMVGVTGKGDVETILESDQTLHRVG